jgi:helicase MOV-10
VRRDEVGLRFHASFGGWTPNQRYMVRFKLNRFPIRRQHQALDTAFTPQRLFFPTARDVTEGPPSRVGLKPFNRLIASNPPQLTAVESIVAKAPGSVPFIIFGP